MKTTTPEKRCPTCQVRAVPLTSNAAQHVYKCAKCKQTITVDRASGETRTHHAG